MTICTFTRGLHYDAAAVALLWRVGVVALVDLNNVNTACQPAESAELTVPHRDGTIQSFGSLSVNAMRLRVRVSRVVPFTAMTATSCARRTLMRPPTRVSCVAPGLLAGAG
jgi:hypothetical protein